MDRSDRIRISRRHSLFYDALFIFGTYCGCHKDGMYLSSDK